MWQRSKNDPLAMDWIPSFRDRLTFFLEPRVYLSTLFSLFLSVILYFLLSNPNVFFLPVGAAAWWIIFWLLIVLLQ